MRASNSSRSALSFCKPCDGLGTPCAARLLATSSARATRHRGHTTNPKCVGVLQEGCCMLPCCQQGSMPVRRAGGRATCARHMHMHMHMSHVHVTCRRTLSLARLRSCPCAPQVITGVRNGLSPWGEERALGGCVAGRTHRQMMWRGCDCSAPRSPGFARAAATLQASCPTAGLGFCANRRRGVGSAGVGE